MRRARIESRLPHPARGGHRRFDRAKQIERRHRRNKQLSQMGASAQNKSVKTKRIVIRYFFTTTILLALLTGAACAQDVPVAPKKPVADKQEDRKAETTSAPRLPPDPNKFAVIISGIGGDEAYSTRFAKWAADLRSALVERLGFAEERVTTLAEKPSEEEQPCSADVVRAVFGKLRNSVKPDNQVFIFFIGHGSFDGKIRSEERRVGKECRAGVAR